MTKREIAKEVVISLYYLGKYAVKKFKERNKYKRPVKKGLTVQVCLPKIANIQTNIGSG